MGTSVPNLQVVYKKTDHVVGLEKRRDGIPGSGDPSPFTAHGVYHGMRAALMELYGNDSFSGRTISVQGVGKVGLPLARMLAENGAHLYLSDIYSDRLDAAQRELGGLTTIVPVGVDDIHGLEVDIYSPCALGRDAVTEETIERLGCRSIVGAANNQLQHPEFARALMERDIIYAPDFAANAGGVINASREVHPRNEAWALSKAAGIYNTLVDIFILAREGRITTNEAALRMAKERIDRARSSQ